MATQTLVRGYLATLRNGQVEKRLAFQYNPTTIDRDRDAAYADNHAALADFPNSPDKALPAFTWIRNNAEEFSFELVFHKNKADENVEEDLRTLDRFMDRDGATGRPLDLVFAMGIRADRVRIISKRVKEELFTPTQQVRRARVTLKLKALRSRTR